MARGSTRDKLSTKYCDKTAKPPSGSCKFVPAYLLASGVTSVRRKAAGVCGNDEGCLLVGFVVESESRYFAKYSYTGVIFNTNSDCTFTFWARGCLCGYEAWSRPFAGFRSGFKWRGQTLNVVLGVHHPTPVPSTALAHFHILLVLSTHACPLRLAAFSSPVNRCS